MCVITIENSSTRTTSATFVPVRFGVGNSSSVSEIGPYLVGMGTQSIRSMYEKT